MEKMRAALADLPGVASSFSQPIALRVDELVSGVKSAIGIKIFGDDLDVLDQTGARVAAALRGTPGVAGVLWIVAGLLVYLAIVEFVGRLIRPVAGDVVASRTDAP